jgi:hypothetical protein
MKTWKVEKGKLIYNHWKPSLHETLNQKYWEGFSPIELESNLVLRPYLYNKVRVLGVLDYLHFRELRYKTNKWQRKFI